MVETTRNMAKINKKGTAYNDFMLGSDNDKHYLLSVYVPANSTVKLKSTAMINALSYNGNAASVSSTSYPHLVAKPTSKNLNSAGQAQYVAGAGPSTTYSSTDDWHEGTTVRTSTQAQGDLLNGFFDRIQHTSACVGAFESKELTVAPQKESYMLNYGYFFGSNGAREEGMQAKDIEVMMSQSHPGSDKISKINKRTRIGTSFTSNKKRISGRI